MMKQINMGNKMTSKNLVLNAVIAEARAKETKAIANLQNYMENPAGIGEHPDIVGEVSKLIKDIAEAREMLSTINNLFESDTEKK